MGCVFVALAGGREGFIGGPDEEGPVEGVDFVQAVFVVMEGDVEEGGGGRGWDGRGGFGFGGHFFVGVWRLRWGFGVIAFEGFFWGGGGGGGMWFVGL